MLRSIMVALVVVSWAPPLQAQELTDADTGAILEAVLNQFRTVNGPIVQMARTIACGDARYTGAARLAFEQPCRSAAIDSVLSRYAVEQEVELVDVTAEMPRCRWSEDIPPERGGLRLDLMAPDTLEGYVRVGILVRCSAIVRGSPRGFFYSARYEVEKVDEVWHVKRLVSSIIS